MLNNASNSSIQCDGCSLANDAWKSTFLENHSAVGPWILNGSSIECHEKKRQPFSLYGVQFGSRAILISVVLVVQIVAATASDPEANERGSSLISRITL